MELHSEGCGASIGIIYLYNDAETQRLWNYYMESLFEYSFTYTAFCRILKLKFKL